jgi:hypothetical protein
MKSLCAFLDEAGSRAKVHCNAVLKVIGTYLEYYQRLNYILALESICCIANVCKEYTTELDVLPFILTHMQNKVNSIEYDNPTLKALLFSFTKIVESMGLKYFVKILNESNANSQIKIDIHYLITFSVVWWILAKSLTKKLQKNYILLLDTIYFIAEDCKEYASELENLPYILLCLQNKFGGLKYDDPLLSRLLSCFAKIIESVGLMYFAKFLNNTSTTTQITVDIRKLIDFSVQIVETAERIDEKNSENIYERIEIERKNKNISIYNESALYGNFQTQDEFEIVRLLFLKHYFLPFLLTFLLLFFCIFFFFFFFPIGFRL